MPLVKIQNSVSMPIRIESGIPGPASVYKKRASYNNYSYIFTKMKVGDSFVIEKTKLPGISVASKRLDVSYVSRSVDEQTVRVWKV
jgi:hypothetical protein